jgi:acid phosphatase family membrane protein YuiD
MNQLQLLLSNRCLWVAILAWFCAQAIKIILCLITTRRFNFALIMGSGGMPSSHSSTVCALTVSVGRLYGLASPLFAIAAVFSFIVMYDAAGVRRAAGEQARILNRIVRNLQEKKSGALDDLPSDLKELIGHTPVQVLAGALLGILLALVLPL